MRKVKTKKPKRKTTARTRRDDPVVTEIVRNGVIAVTEEMKTNLMRTAYNIIIYEALDFTTGLFTPDGETISIGIGLPMFIRVMAETVKAKIRHFGIDNIRPGDIYVTNDSYLTGSHLNHVTLTLPIFHKGKLTAFSCCMAHWLDIGGILGGMSTDIYSEGLQLPILKYQDRGVVNQTVVDIIKQNVRLPSRAMGDLRAQVTAVKTGERRFLQLLDRYGRDAVLDSIAAIMDHAESMARARTRTIPDGVYEAESYMDDDGIDVGKPVPIRVRVTVKGDEMTVDLSEVSKQVRGFYNSGITTGYACAQVAYKCITSPTDYPINDGSFRSLKTIVPPGRVISAVRPAPMRWWMTYPMTIVDTIFKALAPAIPGRVVAGRRRGGLGVERVVRARTNIQVNNQSERAHCRPWGLDGGLEGTGNAVELRLGGQWKTDFPNAKVLVAQLKLGDAFKIRSGGGGGYGSPLERPAEQVAEDVRQGYVTVKAAAELYGVVLDPETYVVDVAATEKLRISRRST